VNLKRLFDVFVSFSGLLVAGIIIIIAWCVSSIETRSNGFFVQKRVGKNGNCFNLIKIKTMMKSTGYDTSITSSCDPRITKTGRFFRNTKIDELPQLWNVLVGDMSIVGPRPDVPGYADKLKGDDRILLSVRPGITGPAQLAYNNEEYILGKQSDPVKYNNEIIWPDKVRINKEYVRTRTFIKDIYYIWKTIIG